MEFIDDYFIPSFKACINEMYSHSLLYIGLTVTCGFWTRGGLADTNEKLQALANSGKM